MSTYNQEKNSGFYNHQNDNAGNSNITLASTEELDKIEDILALTDPNEMENRIYKNSGIINKILRIFYKKLCDNFHISKEETDTLIYCLRFIDTLNLFMHNQTLESLTKVVYDINELVAMINTFEAKDLILKKIRYMEMTVIYYRKKFIRNLFFTDGFALAQEIEGALEQVTQNSGFDQKLFKQMQNIFYVVQGKIEEGKRHELQVKLNEMKTLSLKSKKSRYNYYEDYDDYADYKNYSHTDANNYQDYYDNFNEETTYPSSDYTNANANYYGISGNGNGNGSNKNQNYNNNYNNYNFSGYNSGGHNSGNYYSDYNSVSNNKIYQNSSNYKVKSNNSYYGGVINKKADYNYVELQGSISDIIPENTPKVEEEIENKKESKSNTANNTDVEVISTVVNKTNPISNKNYPKQNNQHQNYYYYGNNTTSGYGTNYNNYYKNSYYYENKSNVQVGGETVVNAVVNNTGNNVNKNKEESTNIADNVTPVKKNKQKNKKKRTMSTDEKLAVKSQIEGQTSSNSKNKKTSSVHIKKNKNNVVIIEKEIVSEDKVTNNQLDNDPQTQEENIPTPTEPNASIPNQEPYEVISVPINKNKNTYNANFNYKNNNAHYKYNKNNYQSNIASNNNFINNQAQNYPYNNNSNKVGRNNKGNSYNYGNNYKYGNNYGYNSNNTNGYEKEKQILRHEFVNLDEVNIKKENENVTETSKRVEVVIDKKPENNNETEVKNEVLPSSESNSGTNKALVDLDVEKMFQVNEQETLKREGVKVKDQLVEESEFNEEEAEGMEGESLEEEIEGMEGIDPIDEELIHEDEDEEDSDSEENELISAEFDKFMRESNMIAMTKNYNEDNYYVDMEENTKNNKIIFEDDTNTNTNLLEENKAPSISVSDNFIKEENVEGKSKGGNEVHSSENEATDLKETTKGYMESLKTIDPKVLLEIKNKLNENTSNNAAENTTTNINSQNQSNPIAPSEDNTNSNNNFYFKQRKYGLMNAKIPLQNYIFANYAHFFYRGRDSNTHREYFALKCLEQENSSIITKNIEAFENKILVPIYQRINFNVNKKRGIYFYTFSKYKKLIYRVLSSDKILKKVKPYGSYMNNFLIDSGDIDICIVPKCGILEFSTYLDKIKEEIIVQNIGEHKLTHHNSRYMLLKVVDQQTKFVIDITVHNMLPILNTNLLRLYSLYDQRFHILGLYVKHWAKINKIHGAADNFLSSYALLIMLIHFLQNTVEPRVLPNLQKIEKKEVNYEYPYNADTVKTNIYYEEDIQKIRAYMNTINGGKVNKDSAAQLLIKFFEYYSYYYDYFEQKVSIHRDPQECFKKNPDSVAFSIEDPFDPNHNPGKSMTINSSQFNKFITAMKKEINFIMNGEYLKRLEKVGGPSS